jgi:hypothetical protein
MQTFLNDSDIAVLNAARAILERISKDAMRLTFDIESGWHAGAVGRAAHGADAAAHAVFDFLSTAKHYGDQAITETQLHNVTEAVPEAVTQ